MTDHEKFKALLDSVGLNYAGLAKELGFTYDSTKSMLAPAKELPKWALSMLLLAKKIKPESYWEFQIILREGKVLTNAEFWERLEKIKEKDSENFG